MNDRWSSSGSTTKINCKEIKRSTSGHIGKVGFRSIVELKMKTMNKSEIEKIIQILEAEYRTKLEAVRKVGHKLDSLRRRLWKLEREEHELLCNTDA